MAGDSESYTCPINNQLMFDPVLGVNANGKSSCKHAFERDAIKQWLTTKGGVATCPCCRSPMNGVTSASKDFTSSMVSHYDTTNAWHEVYFNIDSLIKLISSAGLSNDIGQRYIKLLGHVPDYLNEKNNKDMTPVFVAALKKQYDTLEALAKLGADLDEPAYKDMTLVYAAARKKQYGTLKILKQLGADLDKPNDNGWTPAYAAAQRGEDEILKVLNELGADLDKPDNYGDTPAIAAVQNDQFETLRVLKSLGADLDKPDNDGRTPAYVAAMEGKYEMLRVLKELGADLEKLNDYGWSPAYFAAMERQEETLKVLNELGAKPVSTAPQSIFFRGGSSSCGLNEENSSENGPKK